VLVTWSFGEEPEFKLDDPATWRTLEQNSNVVCHVDRDAAPPTDLDELVCELWTSGATNVKVGATGYLKNGEDGQGDTFQPAEREGCDGPVHSDVKVELLRDPDAGV
jgi:hypothetical protein